MILLHPIELKEVHAEATEWLPEGAYFKCSKTGLQWLYPRNEPVFPDFSAYADQFHRTVSCKTIELDSPPNERAAFEWALKNLKPGARIVEMFAECGRFAWRMRSRGFEMYLADPLPAHVGVLHKHGFPVSLATHPSELPQEWPQPDAVFILESIVRLPAPRGFIEGVRKRFPTAQIYLTAPSIQRPLKIGDVSRRSDYPPDFMTRWTLPALRYLLDTAGYCSRGANISPMLVSSLPKHQWRKRLFNVLFDCFLWVNGELTFSIAAWGVPKESQRE